MIPKAQIKIAFLDVGQGDTIVISSSNTQEALVVDCVNAPSVIDYLEREQIKYLRGVIITHLDFDHYRGVSQLLKNSHLVAGLSECELLAFNDSREEKRRRKAINAVNNIDARKEKSVLADIFAWRETNKLKYSSLKVTVSPLPFRGELSSHIELMHPFDAQYTYLEAKGINNTSIVLKVVNNGVSALLMGDLADAGWQILNRNHPSLLTNILKYPHHGADTIDSNDLLEATQPSVVVLCVGEQGKKYNHPSDDVLLTLQNKLSQIRTYSTHLHGNIFVSLDTTMEVTFDSPNNASLPPPYFTPFDKEISIPE